MASPVPAKSQPLHNFTLPQLKWNKDRKSSGHQHRRRSVNSPSRRPSASSSASPVRHSPFRDSLSLTPPRHQSQSPLIDYAAVPPPPPRKSPVDGDCLRKRTPGSGESSKLFPSLDLAGYSPIGGDDPLFHSARSDFVSESEGSGWSKAALIECRKTHSRNLTLDGASNGVFRAESERALQKFEVKSDAREVAMDENKRSKFLIKIPCKNHKSEEQNPREELLKVNNDEDEDTHEVQGEEKNNCSIDEGIKIWNLRPRKPKHKSLRVDGGSVKNHGLSIPEKNEARSPNDRSEENEVNCGRGGGDEEKKQKKKLSINVSLTKEEIEEDFFAFTGKKPARKPRKRPRNIRKQMDSVFPGLWLFSITEDSYKVSESSLKG